MIPVGLHQFKTLEDPQASFDVAVIMPTIGRDSIIQAVRSIYNQVGVGRIQLLIGIDVQEGNLAELISLLNQSPATVFPYLFWPGYSTSARHGGFSPAFDGGYLRVILSYLANARYLAYLDDDNWWAPQHLLSMLNKINGRDWCYAYRWFVDPTTKQPLCVDTWESVGPGRGTFNERFGGWCDPNTILIDRVGCEPVLRWWGIPIAGDIGAMTADRNVFNWLRQKSQPGETGLATVFYTAQAQQVCAALELINKSSQTKSGS